MKLLNQTKYQRLTKKVEILISNAQEMIAELDRGKLPDQLKFFEGDGSEKDLVLRKIQKNIDNLSKASLEFLEYLSSDYGKDLLQKNKLKIHVESEEIFHDHINTGKNFYFVSDQEDENKRFVNLNLNLSSDLEYYIIRVPSRPKK